MKRTAMYRHFNAAGKLLYVGISLSAVQRLAQHRHTAHWFDDIRRVEVEWFISREDALAAEASAIRTEAPVCNIAKPAASIKALPASGILHIGTGRIDGWYSRHEETIHMLGFWRAVFPHDSFRLVYPMKGDNNYLGDDRILRTTNSKSWAKSKPDYAAGDKYDDLARKATEAQQ